MERKATAIEISRAPSSESAVARQVYSNAESHHTKAPAGRHTVGYKTANDFFNGQPKRPDG